MVFGAFALEFAIEVALALAGFAGDALEGVFFGEAFGFELLEASLQAGGSLGFRERDGFDEERDFTADPVALRQVCFDFLHGAAEEFFVQFC